MQKAVIYARYSSDKQNEQSIEGQLHVCQQYAKANDILVLDTYIDRAMTGTNDNRPDFQRMIKDSEKKEFSYILVYKLDRFSRNKYETAIHKKTLKDNGVKVISATENIPDTPEGIILEALLEGINAYYSAELSQKVKRGLKENYLKGKSPGGHVLYGYDVVNKKNIINELEAQIVKEIFSKYAQGYTVMSIAKDLHTRGIRTKKGNYVDATKIYKILTNEKYTGKAVYGNIEYTNIFPKIIDDETWEKVQAIHQENKHTPGRKKEIFDFILSGKLICGICKCPMVGESGTSHTGTKHYYYSCLSRRRKKHICNLKSINKQHLENIVIQYTWNLLSQNDSVNKIAEEICKLHKEQNINNLQLKRLEKQRASALKASQNLISAIEQGIVTEQTKIRLKELEKQIMELDFDIEKEKQKNYMDLTPQNIISYLNSVMKGDIENISVRKLIVKTFIREIILYQDKVIITYNFTDQAEKNKITPDSTAIIEKQSQKAVFSFYLSSNKLTHRQPFFKKTVEKRLFFCVFDHFAP